MRVFEGCRNATETGAKGVTPRRQHDLSHAAPQAALAGDRFELYLLRMDQGLRLALEAAGGISELARRIGIARQAVQQWRRVPLDRILAVERATGVPREELRPDLYRR